MANKPQRQDSLEDQLRDLIKVANCEGMYDAADYLAGCVEAETEVAGDEDPEQTQLRYWERNGFQPV